MVDINRWAKAEAELNRIGERDAARELYRERQQKRQQRRQPAIWNYQGTGKRTGRK